MEYLVAINVTKLIKTTFVLIFIGKSSTFYEFLSLNKYALQQQEGYCV